MNATDILKYGNLTLHGAIDGLPDADWETGGVCGAWSVKNVIAHLAADEHLLDEVLCGFLEGGSTPYMEAAGKGRGLFNDAQVEARKMLTPAETLAEYTDTHAKVMSRIQRIPVETLRQVGTLPWYGAEYALDDFIVYGFYGHKREHSAQIGVFRDQLKR